MLPGEAPGRGPPPGRGAPGRGACGRGIARSTGCAEENGLFPTRGVRGAGLGPGVAPPGRGPGVGAAGRAGAGADATAAGAAGSAGAAAGSGGAAGLAAGAFSGAGALAAAFFAGAPLPSALTFSAAGFAPPKDSRSRRATGASTVEDADLTNSPCSLSRASTSLLVTPSSLANSCTRALPATSLLSRGDSGGRPRLGFSYDAWSSSGLHGVLMFFATCSLAGRRGASIDSKCSSTADVSGEPVMRSARANARRRIAACKHCWSGCSQAPRPGRLPAASTVTANSPFPPLTATTRSSSTASSRFRQPTHVRTGPSVLRCGEAEVSRWITAQHTVTILADRNAGGSLSVVHSAMCGVGIRLAVVGGSCVASDIDAPAGQPGREPGVLALLADGQ